jgi:hypothetical protein
MWKMLGERWRALAARVAVGIDRALDIFYLVVAIPAWVLGLSSRYSAFRTISFLILCVLPLAVSIIHLPELESLRQSMIENMADKHIGAFFTTSPTTPLLAATLAILSATFVFAGWWRNERVRAKIAAGALQTAAKPLPDLVTIAICAAFVTAIAIPLILYFSNELGCDIGGHCPFVGARHSVVPWADVDADLFTELFPLWLLRDVLEWPTFSRVSPVTRDAGLIETGVRFVWQFGFLATFYATLKITKTVNEAVKSLHNFDNPAVVRLGDRLLDPLYREIGSAVDNRSDDTFLKRAARIIGNIGDINSLDALQRIADRPLNTSTPQRYAVQSINAILSKLSGQKIAWYRFRRKSRVRKALEFYHTWAQSRLNDVVKAGSPVYLTDAINELILTTGETRR